MIPWVLAVFTLMTLYKVLFLYSRGLPQENWTTYFHFSNGIFSMSWLWFLPVLFLFDGLYLVLSGLKLPTAKLELSRAVVAVFLIGLAYTMAVGSLGWYGWTKSAVIDFQNEKVLPYFLVFLLGSLCHPRGIFETTKKNMKLYIAVIATVWIPINLYAIVLINFVLRPGQFFFAESADRLLLWIGYHLSMLSLLYCAVATFKYYFNRQRRLGRELARLSYNVYIIHVIVMGLIALTLVETDLLGMLRYPILMLAAYAVSNLIAYAYRQTMKSTGSRV